MRVTVFQRIKKYSQAIFHVMQPRVEFGSNRNRRYVYGTVFMSLCLSSVYVHVGIDSKCFKRCLFYKRRILDCKKVGVHKSLSTCRRRKLIYTVE